MRRRFKLDCYRKGRCHSPHPHNTSRWLSDTFVLSVWTVSKKYYYLVVESLRTGGFCAIRVKSLLEATVRLREMCDLLKQPLFQNWETEEKKLFETAKPCSLEWRLKQKTMQRLPISEGLLLYSQRDEDPTVFVLVALGRHDQCLKK
jgi:hypothetical protein